MDIFYLTPYSWSREYETSFTPILINSKCKHIYLRRLALEYFVHFTPVDAIFPDDEVPESETDYVKEAADYDYDSSEPGANL